MLVACWCQAALACCGMLWHAVACCGDACGDACGAESTTACDATTPHPTRDKPVHAQAACRATRARNTPHVTRISSAVPGGNGHLSLAHLPGPMPHSHNKHHLASNHTYTHTEEQSWTRLRAFSVACVSLPTPQDTHTHTHAHMHNHTCTPTHVSQTSNVPLPEAADGSRVLHNTHARTARTQRGEAAVTSGRPPAAATHAAAVAAAPLSGTLRQGGRAAAAAAAWTSGTPVRGWGGGTCRRGRTRMCLSACSRRTAARPAASAGPSC